MRKKLLDLIKYLFFGFLAFILLFLAFKNQNPKELFLNLTSLEMRWIYLSILLGALSIIIRGIRWIYMIKSLGYNCKLSNSINSVAIGYLTNLAIPRAGEISRCTTLNKKENIPVDKLFGTIVYERVVDLLVLFFLLLLMFVFNIEKINVFFNSVFSKTQTLPINTVFLFVICLLVISTTLLIVIKKNQSSSILIKIKGFFEGIKVGFVSFNKIKNKSAFWIHTSLIWGLYACMTYFCFFAISETSSLTFMDGIYIMVIGGLSMIVPTQGGIGAYHLATKLGLMSLGIGTDSALTYAFAVHTAQTLMALVFGAISLALLFISKNNVSNK